MSMFGPNEPAIWHGTHRIQRMIGVFMFALAIGACGGGEEADAEPTPLPPVRASADVVSDAIVVPAEHASLGFQAGGTVQQVEVKEGDTVRQGDILVRLDGATEAATVMQAEADVAASEASAQAIDRRRFGRQCPCGQGRSRGCSRGSAFFGKSGLGGRRGP